MIALPAPARAAGAADAVHVILAVVRQVVIEDHLDVIDVQPARGDVGGDEKLNRALAKLRHHALAHRLRDVAVQLVGDIAARREVLGELVHHHLGAAKDDAEFQVLQVDEPAERLDFETAVHLVIDLIDRRHGERLRFDLHLHRIAREGLDQVLDRPRQRGGEEDRLPLGGRLAEHFADVVDEAHVEHPVGFVEDDHLELVELQRAAVEVIHHAPGRADDDLRAGLQAAKLPLVRLPAVDRQLAHAALEGGELRHLLRDLHREFARGAKHQHLRRGERRVHALDRRNRKRRRLARAGLRLPHHVAARQQHRDRLRLDRRRLLVADFFDRLEQLGREVEFRETLFLHVRRTIPGGGEGREGCLQIRAPRAAARKI